MRSCTSDTSAFFSAGRRRKSARINSSLVSGILPTLRRVKASTGLSASASWNQITFVLLSSADLRSSTSASCCVNHSSIATIAP